MKRIALDTSAIVAILLRETDAEHLARVLVDADEVLISAATVMEATIVALRLTGSSSAIEQMVATMPLTVVPFDADQLAVATEGFRRYGKGRHPAKLNYGDCFAYALAKHLDLPLLWKGDDFGQVDVASAVDAFQNGQPA